MVKAPIAESDLKQLSNLPDLIDVALARVRIVSDGSNVQRQINDADLDTVGQLGRLRILVLVHTEISGSGLCTRKTEGPNIPQRIRHTHHRHRDGICR